MANNQGIPIENVRLHMSEGLRVYDSDGNKLGSVDQYDDITGWFVVARNLFTTKDLFIPYTAVTSIDPRELYVSLEKDALERDFSTPPARSTSVQSGLPGRPTAVTTEPSGYDGKPVVVDLVDVERIKAHIGTEMGVTTADNADIGTVKRFDSVTGWMQVQKGLLQPRTLYLPVTIVDRVDDDAQRIYLAVSKADVERMTHIGPAKVVFVEAQAS